VKGPSSLPLELLGSLTKTALITEGAEGSGGSSLLLDECPTKVASTA